MNAPLIPQANPGAAFRSRRDALLKAAADVLDGGWYINGKQVRQFEESFAAFCSVKHAVGVGNGTDAIEVALRALGIGKGGLVFTVSHTAVATIAAIECAGATPVLVDVDPVTYTMSPESLAKALEAARAGRYPGKPAAVLPVHLYGGCADLDAIRAVAGDLPLIEDCAQAHGAAYKGRPAGSTGIAGTFSFYPTKNLGAVGDGGCVVTSDDALAERIRSVREYGWRTHYLSSEPGINTRLDELQAAFLNVLLPELPYNIHHNLNLRLGTQKTADNAVKGQLQLLPLVNKLPHLLRVVVKEVDRESCVVGQNGGGDGAALDLHRR